MVLFLSGDTGREPRSRLENGNYIFTRLFYTLHLQKNGLTLREIYNIEISHE